MKKTNFIYAITILLLLISCNEESLIEGRIPTKPVIIEINEDILKGFQKNISINIEGINYTFNPNYYYQLSGNTEVRQIGFTNGNNPTVDYFTFVQSGNYIGVATEGQEINTLFTSQLLYAGLLLYSINTINTTNYSYYTNNGATYDNLLYIPFKTLNLDTQTTSIYGWFSCEISPEKITIYKCVYRKIGTIEAGEE